MRAVALYAVAFAAMITAGAAFATVTEASDGLLVDIVDGRFVVSQQEIPAGCMGRLMTKLNGDDVTRSVFLTRSTFRGCIDANEPGPDADYEIVQDKGNDTYDVRVCERVDGSMGGACATLVLRFAVYSYESAGVAKAVLALDKLGED